MATQGPQETTIIAHMIQLFNQRITTRPAGLLLINHMKVPKSLARITIIATREALQMNNDKE